MKHRNLINLLYKEWRNKVRLYAEGICTAQDVNWAAGLYFDARLMLAETV